MSGHPTTPDERAARAKRQACELAVLVRDEGQESISAWLAALDHDQLAVLAVVLACMVPDDEPVAQLLAWIEPPPTRLRARLDPHAEWVRQSHRDYVRLTAKQQRPIPADVMAGERVYQRGRKRDRSGTVAAVVAEPQPITPDEREAAA